MLRLLISITDLALLTSRLHDQIIDAHPHLTLEAVHDALSYYYEKRDFFDEEIKKKIKATEKIARKKPTISKKVSLRIDIKLISQFDFITGG